jgi:hypothetical protein
VADAAHSNPPLSTISVDPGRLGEVAAELLLSVCVSLRPRRCATSPPPDSSSGSLPAPTPSRSSRPMAGAAAH